MRIACLSAEAADICFRLGAWDCVAGVSAFCPNHAPKKPIVFGFSTGHIDRILAVDPDLVITFSDVQAKIARELIAAGCPVLALNHHSFNGISDTIRLLGRLLNVTAKGLRLAKHFELETANLRFAPAHRPRIYFEEWDNPMISGSGWVSELIWLAGGRNAFEDMVAFKASDRIVLPEQVISANPEIILASWCGKSVDVRSICLRSGFEKVEAVRRSQVFALDSNKVLQAGPVLLEGLKEVRAIVQAWCYRQTK